jgi:chorismate mutase
MADEEQRPPSKKKIAAHKADNKHMIVEDEVQESEMVAKIAELKNKEETVTEMKLATALMSFERVVDLACKNARPNMRWR